MFFIDELDDNKLYRREFMLPINETNKRFGSLAFLFGKDPKSSEDMMSYKFLNNKHFSSYYTERSVMYYISESDGKYLFDEDSIITEDIETIIKDSALNLRYSGYSEDVEEVLRLLHADIVYKYAMEYRIKIPRHIKVSIYRTSKTPTHTKDTINVCSSNTYNKNIASYKHYLHYCVMEYLLSRIKLVPKLYNAACLYGSGLYDFFKDKKWIFNSDLKRYCTFIDNYIKKNGFRDYVLNILHKNNIGGLSDTLDMSVHKTLDDLEDIFGLNEGEENGFTITKELLPLNESTYMAFHEDSGYNNQLRSILYKDRMKTTQDLLLHYDGIVERNSDIKYTFTDITRYKNMNLFSDYGFYIDSFVRNNKFKNTKGYLIFLELLERILHDERYSTYNKRTIIFNVDEWNIMDRFIYIKDSINPLSCIYHLMLNEPDRLKELFGSDIVLFTSEQMYFKLDLENIDNIKSIIPKFLSNIRAIVSKDNSDVTGEDPIKKDSDKAIKAITVDAIERSSKGSIKIDNLKVDNNPSDETNDNELLKNIDDLSKTKTSAEDLMNSEDERLKQILLDLTSTNGDQKLTTNRASRVLKLQNNLGDKIVKGKTIKDILVDSEGLDSSIKIDPIKLDVNTVNPEWENLTFANAPNAYNMDSDIVGIFNSFSYMSKPLYINKIEANDTSTVDDTIETYTVGYESDLGKRFTIKVDIPIWVDNKYLNLRGNKKELPAQLFLMPISKTGPDTVQIVTNYNKIFIERFGTTSGKSNIHCDKLIKILTKLDTKGVKKILGDNSKACNRYELPIDYVDLSSTFTTLETKSYVFQFNPDKLYKTLDIKEDVNKGACIGYKKANKEPIYFNGIVDGRSYFLSQYIIDLINEDVLYFKSKTYMMSESIRYTYSKASILNTMIPVVVICAYSEGLTKVLDKAGIEYKLSNKSSRELDEDIIKFNDGYLIYKLDYNSSLLMNGLKACNTSDYSISEVNDSKMYLEFLDLFGGRVKADGLDNFYNLMIDRPITTDTLAYYKLPTDYIELLIYANRLLADNKYYAHSNVANNRRIRRHEQIPAILYKVVAKSYAEYCTSLKHGRDTVMSIKQSAVIDEVLTNSTTAEMSIVNPLTEYESYATVTPKGPSGMNSDRSYTLDKRAYDESMRGLLSMSTGFAGNAGVFRQATIDANANTTRGFVTNDSNLKKDQFDPVKDFCMTESLTPLGCTRDDPMRTAMTFIQTSKHAMRCKVSHPLLITTGADEALPHLISNMFAVKAKRKGTVMELDKDRMVVQYDDGNYDYISLENKVEKNSSIGKYTTLQISTDLKVGSKFKSGEIIAYDKQSFNKQSSDNPTYANTIMTKFALLNTDEGFEDGVIISNALSDAGTSDIVILKDLNLSSMTNIYNLVKKGQTINEGDTLAIIQPSFDDEDVNNLIKNLTDSEEEVSNLGRIHVTSKVTGIVQDIIIKRTVDIDELSPTLKKEVKSYESNINKKQKELNQYKISDIQLESTEKLPPVGKLKGLEGVRIEIYLKYEDKLSIGDKIVMYSANKGVIKELFPVGKEPTSTHRPTENIHILTSVGACNGRMVTSVITVGALNKLLIETTRQCKDILGIDYDIDII